MKAKKYTKAQWEQAIDWAQEFLGLQDWVFTTWHGGKPEWVVGDDDSLGSSIWARGTKRAKLWVDHAGCRACKMDPFQVLFHEILHVAFADIGLETDNPRAEFLLNCLEKAMLAAYRKGVT